DTTFREFTRCQYCEEGNRRGLGFDKPLIEYNPKTSSVCAEVSPESFGHSGYTGTFVWMDPKYRLVYIFFSNRVYPSREHTQIYSLNVRPRIQHAIYQSFLK
ncbi:MAG: serine hydrolase, partial [Saprospiraceae bacterium]|nr:serine hydrolase [Saprospiraceae bacterium]